MERFYEVYEKPPGPDRQRFESENRLQQYSNDGFNVTSSDEGTRYEYGNNYNSNKRRSWQDMLDQQSLTYLSDNSSFNSSYSTVLTNKPHQSVNGGKRRSWDKLMESDENLKKHDNLVVSILPEPLKPISLMMVKDGRLGKVNLYNKKPRKIKNPSTSSKTSTISEFILVPRPDSTDSIVDISDNLSVSDNKNNSFNKVDEDENVLCNWSARRSTFAIITTLGLCIFVGLIGYFFRKLLESNNNEYSLNLFNTKDSSSYILNVFFTKSTAIVFMNGSSYLKQTQTLLDFKNKLIIHQNVSLNDYCFVQKLNESYLPNKEVIKAALSSSSKQPRNVEWFQNWNYQATDAKDSVSYDEDFQHFCGNKRNIFSLQTNSLDQKNFQCIQCSPICFPDYGLSKISDREWIFTVLSEKCFLFSAHLSPQTTANPTQNSFANRFFNPQQQWQQQPQQQSLQFRESYFNFNQGNLLMPFSSNNNGALWPNGQNFGR